MQAVGSARKPDLSNVKSKISTGTEFLVVIIVYHVTIVGNLTRVAEEILALTTQLLPQPGQWQYSVAVPQSAYPNIQIWIQPFYYSYQKFFIVIKYIFY